MLSFCVFMGLRSVLAWGQFVRGGAGFPVRPGWAQFFSDVCCLLPRASISFVILLHTVFGHRGRPVPFPFVGSGFLFRLAVVHTAAPSVVLGFGYPAGHIFRPSQGSVVFGFCLRLPPPAPGLSAPPFRSAPCILHPALLANDSDFPPSVIRRYLN